MLRVIADGDTGGSTKFKLPDCGLGFSHFSIGRRIETTAMRIDPFKSRGGGFIRLPAIKQATAGKTGPDIVALTLEFEDGGAATTVSTQMTAAEAHDLAIRIWMEADQRYEPPLST